jgi:hypothetical protein
MKDNRGYGRGFGDNGLVSIIKMLIIVVILLAIAFGWSASRYFQNGNNDPLQRRTTIPASMPRGPRQYLDVPYNEGEIWNDESPPRQIRLDRGE